MNLHLSHEQLCDLIFADLSCNPENDSDVVHEHLRACLICSAELKSLRDSLSVFRDASVSYAHREFARSHVRRSSIAPPQSYLMQPLYWAAAVIVLVAALFPLSMRRQQAPAPATARSSTAANATKESDAALLADIDQELSADVPSPMEPLADPTAEAPASYSAAPSDQRKN